MRLYLHEVSRIVKSTEEKSRLVTARGWREEKVGSECLMSTGLSSGGNKNVLE